MTIFSDVAWCLAAGSLMLALYGLVQVGRIGHRMWYPEPNRFIERCHSDTHLEVVHNNLVFYQHPFASRFSSTRDIIEAKGFDTNYQWWCDVTDLAVAYDGPDGGALPKMFVSGAGRLADYSAIKVKYSDNMVERYERNHSCDPDSN
jgi:hypothetical protein